MNPERRRNRVQALATTRHHNATAAVLLIFVCWYLSAVVGTTNRNLRVRSVPSVDGISSSLYEVYVPPYFFDGPVVTARASLSGSNTEAVGELRLEQAAPPFGPVAVRGNATGLPPGLYRLFVTILGDLRDGCDSLQPAYSPYQVSAEPGVLADLGGVVAGDDGAAAVNLLVPVISLTGPRGVAGRGLLLRKEPPGAAAICGTVAYSRPVQPRHPHPHPHQPHGPGDDASQDNAEELTA
ncbi:superoxide dismutase [Cu-Zn]-like [Schistocerca serialis cubense]|uniref:superoxide dismutase [Cu-Zn]-like n=1 Tax=Schistocerca serialis cubense TaxID=2023355 RepID=UPI00214E3964|nr:superoxide dismutase [Cu-Zn]-like [Schistocerca serialis cubense]